MTKKSWITILFLILFTSVSAEVTGGSFEELNAEIKRLKKIYPEEALRMDFKRTVDDTKDCRRCPSHLKLTSAVNGILARLARDPEASAERLPLKVSRLKMQFYSVKSLDPYNNQIRCQTYEDFSYAITPKDRKMSGEAKLISEEFFDISAFDNLLYNDPSSEKVIYYFRDEFYHDVLVQIVAEKGKNPVIRYFKYYPSSTEQKDIDLPAMGEEYDRSSPDRIADQAPISIKTEDGPLSEGSPVSGLNVRFKPTLVKRGILPRDYYIGDASLSKELIEGIILSGDSKLSVAKGNEANLRLNTKEGEVLQVRLNTKLNGRTEHAIVVPYLIPLSEDGTGVRGALQDETYARSASLSLVSDHSEMIRATARQNKETGGNSVILSRDVAMAGGKVLSLSAGRDETRANFVAARHSSVINKSTSIVVDFKLDSERRTTLYYTLTTRF